MEKLRLIQCGAGGFGAGWVKNHIATSLDFELVALVDISQEALNEAGEVAGIPRERRFTSLEQALDNLPADAVLTVTPPAVHARHALLAFSRGLHFITEKPIADTLESAKEMVAQADQHGCQMVVSQNYRFNPSIRKLKQILEAETLGQLGHGQLDFYIPADFTGGFRETMDFPLLLDMAIHHFDLIRCVTGRNITSVYAHSFRPDWSWYRHDPALKMILELEGGIPLSYSGDWSARGRPTSWSCNWRLQCADGSLHYEPDQISMTRSEKWAKDVVTEQVAAEPIPYSNQAATLHSLAEAIRSGQPAETSGRDNLQSFAPIFAAMRSVAERRPVAVSELLDE